MIATLVYLIILLINQLFSLKKLSKAISVGILLISIVNIWLPLDLSPYYKFLFLPGIELLDPVIVGVFLGLCLTLKGFYDDDIFDGFNLALLCVCISLPSIPLILLAIVYLLGLAKVGIVRFSSLFLPLLVAYTGLISSELCLSFICLFLLCWYSISNFKIRLLSLLGAYVCLYEVSLFTVQKSFLIFSIVLGFVYLIKYFFDEKQSFLHKDLFLSLAITFLAIDSYLKLNVLPEFLLLLLVTSYLYDFLIKKVFIQNENGVESYRLVMGNKNFTIIAALLGVFFPFGPLFNSFAYFVDLSTGSMLYVYILLFITIVSFVVIYKAYFHFEVALAESVYSDFVQFLAILIVPIIGLVILPYDPIGFYSASTISDSFLKQYFILLCIFILNYLIVIYVNKNTRDKFLYWSVQIAQKLKHSLQTFETISLAPHLYIVKVINKSVVLTSFLFKDVLHKEISIDNYKYLLTRDNNFTAHTASVVFVFLLSVLIVVYYGYSL